MLRSGEWLRALVLALGTVVVWHFHYVATATVYPSFGAGDVFGYFLPAYEVLAERMRAGQIAFWNPWQGAGVPMLATLQAGVLYPPRLLLLVLPADVTLGVLAIGHVILGVLATDRLCRRLGASALASAVGAMVFAGSVALPRTINPTLLEPACWLPVAGVALVALVERATWGWAVLLGLSLAMPLLCGGYQICVYVAYGIAILGLALLADGRWRPLLLRRVVIVRLAGAALIAAATAMPQALPTIDWSAMTSRQVGQLTDEQIFPRFFSMIAFFREQVPIQVLYRTDPMSGWLLTVPVAVLALIGFLTNRGLGLVLGLGAAFAYTVLLGPGTQLFALYRWLPGIGMFRLPVRIWVLAGFAAAVGAALGTSRLGDLLRRPLLRWPIEAALAVMVFLYLVWPATNLDHYPWTKPPFVEPAFMKNTAAIVGNDRAWLPGDRLDLGFGVYPRWGMRRHIRVLQDYEPLSARRLGAFLTAVTDVPYDADPAQPFTGSILNLPHLERPHLLDLVAARAVVTPKATLDDPPAIGWRQVEDGITLALYENSHALPRAYVTTLVDFAPTEDDALARLLPATPAVHDGVVLVGSPDEANPATRTARQASPIAPARFVRDEPEHLAIAVAPTQPGVLVVADAFADGWTARVDGVPRRLWQANYLVRGVEVRPGDQLVELEYRAPGFRTGVVVLLAGWLLAFALAMADRYLAT